MSCGGSVFQINSFERNLNFMACTIYSPNVTEDREAN